MSCLCCGESTTEHRGRRLLLSDSSRTVLPLWGYLFKEELNVRGMSLDPFDLVRSGGRVCRKCFTALERSSKLLAELRHNISQAVQSLGAPGQDGVGSTRGIVRSSSFLLPTTVTSSPDVTVQVQYKQPRVYRLTPKRKRVGKAIARGRKRVVVEECFKDPVMKRYVMEKVGKVARSELKSMCSVPVSSVLQKQSKDVYDDFSWDLLYAELEVNAPILLSLLESCTQTRRPRQNRRAVIGMCVAILLKHCFAKMSLVQRVVSLILYAGHSGKQVYQRLQKLNICMSHQMTSSLIAAVGGDYDQQVHQWRQHMVSELESTRESEASQLWQTLSRLCVGNLDGLQTPDSQSSSRSSECPSPDSPEIVDHCNSDDEILSPVVSEPELDMEDEDVLDRSSLVSGCDDGCSCPMELEPERDTNTEGENLTSAIPTAISSCVSGTFGYKLVGDNIDFTVNARYMRTDGRGNQSLHYFHCYAILDRIDFSKFSIKSPIVHLTPSPSDLDLMSSTLLPSTVDDKAMSRNVATLISRLLAAHTSYFKHACSDVVTWHIRHEYCKEMGQKSQVIPLGVLLKNENLGAEMIEIISHLYQYVPSKEFTNLVFIPSTSTFVLKESAIVHNILFGGDQLTVARARGAITAMANNPTPKTRLEGVVPVVEDWHALVVLLQVIWKSFFGKESAREHGTIYQLKNLINRTNVPTDPKSNYNASDDFFKLIINSFLLTAALDVLGMNTLEDTPSSAVIPSPDTLWMKSKEERKQVLEDVCDKVVAKYVHLAYNTTPASSNDDKVVDYSKHLLSIGSFYIEFQDAIREGDGDRVLRCWRYLLPIFRHSGRRNYCLEAFKLLHQYHHVLPPRQAEQLKWSRFVNTHGVPGRNIPMDFHQEHLNRLCKTTIHSLGPNRKDEAVIRCGKALGTVHNVLNQFDKDNAVAVPSGAHSHPSYQKELCTLIKGIKQNNILVEIPGRMHSSFPKPRSILHAQPYQNIKTYVLEHLQSNAIHRCP